MRTFNSMTSDIKSFLQHQKIKQLFEMNNSDKSYYNTNVCLEFIKLISVS